MGLGQAGRAVGLFTVTNIDGLVLLALFCGQAAGRCGGVLRVVLGQYLGFIGIMAVAVAGALGAGLLPESVLPYLGLSPLVLGLRAAWRLWRERHDQGHDGMTEPAGPGALSVAAVTFANGGDNIGVYVPVFTQSSPGGLATYVVVFWSLSPSGARQDACSPPGRSSPVR